MSLLPISWVTDEEIWVFRRMVINRRKLMHVPFAILSTTNPTRTALGSNPDLCSKSS
jgi:hypothetical protein